MLLLATFFPTAGDYNNEDDPEGFSPVRLVSLCCFYTVYLSIFSIVPGTLEMHS